MSEVVFIAVRSALHRILEDLCTALPMPADGTSCGTGLIWFGVVVITWAPSGVLFLTRAIGWQFASWMCPAARI